MNNENFHPEMKSRQPFGFVLTGLVTLVIGIFLPFKITQNLFYISSIISGYQLGILTLLLIFSAFLLGISAYLYRRSDNFTKIRQAILIGLIGIVIGIISFLIFIILNPVKPLDNEFDILYQPYTEYSTYSYGIGIGFFGLTMVAIGLIKMHLQIKQLSSSESVNPVIKKDNQAGIDKKSNLLPVKPLISNNYYENKPNYTGNDEIITIAKDTPSLPNFCPNCGGKTEKAVNFCQTCGQKLN